MPRLPNTISFIRLREISRRRAASTCPSCIGFRNSSRRTSPGEIAGPSQFGSLVIVFDRDFEGMAILPSKRDAILLVHTDAVAPAHRALEGFQTIARRRLQIVDPDGNIEHLQLSLHDAPQSLGDVSRVPRVAPLEEVGGCLVRERLN